MRADSTGALLAVQAATRAKSDIVYILRTTTTRAEKSPDVRQDQAPWRMSGPFDCALLLLPALADGARRVTSDDSRDYRQAQQREQGLLHDHLLVSSCRTLQLGA